MLSFKVRIRQKLRVRFIILHQELFEKLNTKMHAKIWLSDEGRKIIDYARQKIGYKNTYSNQDLLCSMNRTYKYLKRQNKLQ